MIEFRCRDLPDDDACIGSLLVAGSRNADNEWSSSLFKVIIGEDTKFVNISMTISFTDRAVEELR